MKYMLDTNVCISIIRQKPAELLEKLTRLAPGEVGVSAITVSELACGAQKSNFPAQNMAALEQFLLPLEIAEYGHAAATTYGKIRAELERNDQPIGAMDILIGAHALSLNIVLVTNNTREFQRIPNLKLEDWITG
ncbi:MAG: type II toxin-antitoxin system VapC family toxin [Anaerolineales bacterium]